MWIWFAIPLGVGIIAAFVAVARHSGREGIYVGVVEKDLATDTDQEGLHVRAYVDEALATEQSGPNEPLFDYVATDVYRSVTRSSFNRAVRSISSSS